MLIVWSLINHCSVPLLNSMFLLHEMMLSEKQIILSFIPSSALQNPQTGVTKVPRLDGFTAEYYVFAEIDCSLRWCNK